MDGLSVAANIYAVIGVAKMVADALRRILSFRNAPQEILQADCATFLGEKWPALCQLQFL